MDRFSAPPLLTKLLYLFSKIVVGGLSILYCVIELGVFSLHFLINFWSKKLSDIWLDWFWVDPNNIDIWHIDNPKKIHVPIINREKKLKNQS
jgi:hypothetical protein